MTQLKQRCARGCMMGIQENILNVEFYSVVAQVRNNVRKCDGANEDLMEFMYICMYNMYGVGRAIFLWAVQPEFTHVWD